MKAKVAANTPPENQGLLSPWAAALALSVLMLYTELGHAQSVKPEDQVPVAKRWSVVAGVGQSQSLYLTNDGKDQASTDLSASLRFRLAPKTLLSLAVAGSFDNKQEDSDLSQASASLSQSRITLANDYILWTPSVSAQLPASRRNIAASMKGVLGFANRLDLNSEKMGWTRASVAYLASASHAFYEFETSVTGAVNQPFRLSQGLEFSWAISDQVFLVIFGSHGLRRSVNAEYSESFTHAEEIYAQINSNFGISLGHQLGANIRAANGQDLNLRLSSDQDSIVYLQTSLIF